MAQTMESTHMSHIRLAMAAILVLAFCAPAFMTPAWADTAAPPATFEQTKGHFPQQSGADIYKGVCQGCHMPDAKGAVGAGKYPALANNPNLAAAGYPVAIVLHGQKAMPWFNEYFSDGQIANVVNYVRSNFGNHYTDKVTPADVKAQR
jgi:mono/diheme cytochrome c family protein